VNIHTLRFYIYNIYIFNIYYIYYRKVTVGDQVFGLSAHHPSSTYVRVGQKLVLKYFLKEHFATHHYHLEKGARITENNRGCLSHGKIDICFSLSC
jgi:hypothetical protein